MSHFSLIAFFLPPLSPIFLVARALAFCYLVAMPRSSSLASSPATSQVITAFDARVQAIASPEGSRRLKEAFEKAPRLLGHPMPSRPR
jgi:hypothetical protein